LRRSAASRSFSATARKRTASILSLARSRRFKPPGRECLSQVGSSVHARHPTRVETALCSHGRSGFTREWNGD
jgi:hypothetical protein